MLDVKISVIIPSFDGYRGGNCGRLKKQISEQTLPPSEIITVIGASPNGKARNLGVEKASGDYYVFIDDDVTLGDKTVFEKLIRPFSDRNDIGMTGPSQLIPEDSNSFQRLAAKQIPRSVFPIQKDIIDSDMVSHMCLAMPAKLFKSLGWENPDIISGTDPDLRYRVREAGFRVCVVPEAWAYHPMPETFLKLMRLSFVKGQNSALTGILYPHLVFELDAGWRKDFPSRRKIGSRILRAIFNMFISVFHLKIIYVCSMVAYYIGFALLRVSKK